MFNLDLGVSGVSVGVSVFSLVHPCKALVYRGLKPMGVSGVSIYSKRLTGIYNTTRLGTDSSVHSTHRVQPPIEMHILDTPDTPKRLKDICTNGFRGGTFGFCYSALAHRTI